MKDESEYFEDEDEDDGITSGNAIDKLIEQGKLTKEQIAVIEGKASKQLDDVIEMKHSKKHATESTEVTGVKVQKMPDTSMIREKQDFKVAKTMSRKQVQKEKVHIPVSACEVTPHTMGRLSLPEELHFSDYSASQISDLTLLTEDNALVSLVDAVEENCYEDIDIREASQDELFEILISILKKFRTDKIRFPFLCNCQAMKPLAKRKYGMAEVKIDDLILNNLPEVIVEPIKMGGETVDGEEYESEWRLSRVKDIINAGDYLKKKYHAQQKAIDNMIVAGIPKAELELRKEEEQKKLDMIKIKETTPLMQSMCLVSFNGELVNEKTRLHSFSLIPYSDVETLFERIDSHEIGYYKYASCTCEECGETEERRLLFQFLSLLPTVNTRRSSGKTVFTGI